MQALRAAQRGFTLLELLVVLAIIAIATGTAALAFRDPDRHALQREGERLAALLEGGRAWSRSSGLALAWQEAPGGFVFAGRQPPEPPQRWLSPSVAVEWPNAGRALVLGPEPMIAAQSVVLRLGQERLRLATDGLRPFSLSPP